MARKTSTKTKSPTKSSNMVRGPGGSSFIDCPHCKKSVPAIFGDSHKEECAKKNAASTEEKVAKPVEEVKKKRKVEEDKKAEPTTKKGKKEEENTEKQVEEEEEEDVEKAVDSALKQVEQTQKVEAKAEAKIEKVAAKSDAKTDAQWWGKSEAENDTTSDDHTILRNLREPTWREVLQPEFKKDYFKKILTFLESEKKAGKKIYPPEEDVFNAFNLTPFDKVKVVIIGQDPYHGAGQAHGLCFSVKKGVATPPSLKNIYKELTNDIPGFKTPNHGCLERWAKQGVLMLNATLTVVASTPNSHEKIGWQTFTDSVIKAINDKLEGVVFILWGAFAQKKASIVSTKRHHVLKAAHPSPYSADKFFGCKSFSQTNAYLKKNGKEPIDWNVDE